jgi:hypothetical protein
MISSRYIALFALVALSGCPMKNSDPEPDGGGGTAGAGGEGGVGGDEMTKLPRPDAAPPDPGKPLAEGCATNAECASGFCTDGVCCASVCDQPCYTCHLTGSFGSCLPQLYGDDPTATPACTGAKTCGFNQDFLTSGNLSACNLKNLQKCSVNGDCASGNCVTYYTDADSDGYGSSNALKLCNDSGVAAPPGFSTVTGDCCDSDAAANPAVTSTTWFDYADACGSYDYNCDGKIEQQYSPSKPVACGAIEFINKLMGCH